MVEVKTESSIGSRWWQGGMEQARQSNSAGLLLSLAVLIGLLALTTPYFFTFENGLNVVRAVSFIGIAAASATMVLVAGGVDLSMAAVMALAGTTAAGLMDAGYSPILAALAGLGMGLIVGVINAILIVHFQLNPLIATIGTQFAARGAAYLVVNNRELYVFEPSFVWFGQATLGPIPVSGLLMVAVFVFFGWLMRSTVFGGQIYAIGGTPNGLSAKLSGVPVRRRLIQVYIVSGIFSALAGLLLASYSGSAAGYAAMGLELPILAAAILGGAALGGGRGTVWGTLIGVILVGVINNGLTLNNVTLAWLFVVQGSILVIAVLLDERRNAKR